MKSLIVNSAAAGYAASTAVWDIAEASFGWATLNLAAVAVLALFARHDLAMVRAERVDGERIAYDRGRLDVIHERILIERRTSRMRNNTTPPRTYPCLDCGGVYPSPDHACPQESVRR